VERRLAVEVAVVAVDGVREMAMTTATLRAFLFSACLGASFASSAEAQDRQGLQAAQVPAAAQRQFATPDEAADALKIALLKDDVGALLDIFGQDSRGLILSADPAVSRVERQRAARLVQERLSVVRDGPDRALLVVGSKAWLLPIPLVQQGGSWVFDTAAGEQEILARRIGQDELGAIAALKAFVAAEKSYAARLRKVGKPVEYARFIQSTPGDTDGLWWNAATATKAGPSPLSKFVDSERKFLTDRRPGDPFRGYYFRILIGQGEHAPHGAMSYFENGRMTRGFAMIGWPADYRSTGVMTFVVGPDGHVLQKDLGEETASVVQALHVYDPDDSWTPAE
jgi:hypothetical protein